MKHTDLTFSTKCDKIEPRLEDDGESTGGIVVKWLSDEARRESERRLYERHEKLHGKSQCSNCRFWAGTEYPLRCVLFGRVPFRFEKTLRKTAQAARNGEFDEPEYVPIGRTVCCARESYADLYEYGHVSGREELELSNAEYYFGDDPDWYIEDQPWYIEEGPSLEEDVIRICDAAIRPSGQHSGG